MEKYNRLEQKEIITTAFSVMEESQSKNSIDEKIGWKELIQLMIGIVTIASVFLYCCILWPEKSESVGIIFFGIMAFLGGLGVFIEEFTKNPGALIIQLCGVLVMVLVVQHAYLIKIGCVVLSLEAPTTTSVMVK